MSQQDLEYARSIMSWLDEYVRQPHAIPSTANLYVQMANTWAFIASCDKEGPGGSI